MDAAARSSSAFLVVEGLVPVHGLAVPPGKHWRNIPAPAPPGKEWAIVKFASKKAYGCGEGGQRLVDGLTLYVCRAGYPDLTASLSIGLSCEAVKILEDELGVRRSLVSTVAAVKISHQQLLVIFLVFRPQAHANRTYYLVYDPTDASLSMIPFIPRDLEATYTEEPVVERSSGLKLALTAQTFWPQRFDRHCLCVFTAAAQTDPESESTVTWQRKVHKFLRSRQRFSAEVMFSLQGKLFWGDLSRGIAYSDLSTGCSVVDTVFIRLPDEYHRDERPETLFDLPRVNRTMGCVAGSIKFVCIDRCHEMVKVLTLDLNRQQWKEDEGFSRSLNDLWKQSDFGFMNVKMSEGKRPQPMYPTLMPDGALFFLLPNVPERVSLREGNYQVCSFDMSSKRILCLGLVHDYHTVGPMILPPDFFTICQSSSAPAEAEKDLEADVSRAEF